MAPARRATSGVASFDRNSFDTDSFAELAWLFDAAGPEPEPTPRGGGLDLDYVRIGPDAKRIQREDEEMLAVIAAFLEIIE